MVQTISPRCVAVLLLAATRCGGLLLAKNRHQEKDASDDDPYCSFGTRGQFNGSVSVFIGKDNSRSFTFGTDDWGTQTMVNCRGDIPPGCASLAPTPSNGNSKSCEDMGCVCEPDTSSLQFVYMKKMMDIALPMCEQKEDGFNALIIGLGGGALPEYLLEHCPQSAQIESIEYDPRVIDVATNFFGFHVVPGRNEIQNRDGGEAVKERVEAGKKYDLVLVDCFQTGGHVPDSCRSNDFITGLHSILKPGGKAIQQVWGSQYDSILGAYSNVFGKDHAQGENVQLQVNFLIVGDAA